MAIYDYVTEQEKHDFCFDCSEICSRHCVIYRKAEMRYDEEMAKEVPPGWNERYLNTLGMSMRDFL